MAAYFSLFLLLQQLLLRLLLQLLLPQLQFAQADPPLDTLQQLAAAAARRPGDPDAAAAALKPAAAETTLRGVHGQQESSAPLSTAAATAAATADAAAATADAAAAAVERLLKGQLELPLTYSSILSLLPLLQQRFPHLVRVKDAVKVFGLQDEAKELICGNQTCRVPYVELGLRSSLNRSTPTIFYSGLLHGDEVVGPTVAVYLVALLASQFSELDEVSALLTIESLAGGFPFL
ncbi:zinc carboxypeptidase, putative [Eimeria mitis]|uniref:Zinc carboxypeptidase, putative n=1 Tax=Eimeria mitis TaxID=44415 RepID=U6K8F7_9EIME|nr:zinc carboxypeptidase, putative [Eimeria mitis]CDJ33111.1 zinc carboxypeptidase, putative [Eimeria mitis]